MRKHEGEGLARTEERVREALRRRPPAAADPAFRARLRREFVSGGIAAQRAPAPASPRAPRWLWLPAAAAATAILAVALLGRGPSWQVRSIEGGGGIVVRGRTVPLSPAGAWLGSIDRGARLVTPEGVTIDLVRGDVLLARVAPGSDVSLPQRGNRWLAPAMQSQVRSGELLVSTGPGFRGRELIVDTPEGRTVLSGTAVSVFRGDGFTCVCVLEGTARVGATASRMEPVPAGMRKVMFSGGKPPMLVEIEPHHREGLREFLEENPPAPGE